MSNLAASRVILRRVREGVSIGMTGDGPLGPSHIAVKDPPLDWARVMKRPVYAYAFATKRHRISGKLGQDDAAPALHARGGGLPTSRG